MTEWCPELCAETTEDHSGRDCNSYHLNVPILYPIHKRWAVEEYDAKISGVPLFEVVKKDDPNE